MGKKRKQNAGKKAADRHHDNDDSSNFSEPDQGSEGYFNDEIEAFATKDDKILLDQDDVDSFDESDYIDDDDEDEIMKLESDDEDEDSEIEDVNKDNKHDSEDDEDFLSEGDGVDDEAGLPNQKAWGRKKKEFYDSNLKDADHFENEEEEELVTVEEEKEAMALQQRMASHLDQEDFDFFEPGEKEADEQGDVIEMEEETHIVQDLQSLSKEEKIQLLMKESPELFVLLDDYEAKLSEVIDKYHPLLLIARKSDKISPEGRDFIEVVHQLLLNYCLNISFYLWLKAKRESVKDHPVIEKIVEYRNLLSKVEPLMKSVEEEIPIILKKAAGADDASMAAADTLSKYDIKTLANEAKSMKSDILQSKSKKDRSKKKGTQKIKDSSKTMQDPWDYYNSVAEKVKEKQQLAKESCQTSTAAQDDEDNDGETEGKRAITYEMAKNKGLIRKRKKENRNPRVKHKMKFKKAVIKRKSQVPAIRNEAVNYGGELTGIKSRVVKSVKIK